MRVDRHDAAMETVAVLDFETTGLSPQQGDRPTELAIVLLRGGEVVDRFQRLMNPGRPIPPFVTALTGITDALVARAPPVEAVMREAAGFVGDRPLVAHNASFDRRFWEAERARIGLDAGGSFACTMLLARRLYPSLTSHRLGALASALRLPDTGRAHRAMADAETAAHLWCRIVDEARRRFGATAAAHAALAAAQRAAPGRVAEVLVRGARPSAGQSVDPPDGPSPAGVSMR
jgi:DNA polymerase III subunit epsilon